MNGLSVPEFKPHPLLRGGHMQTLAGNYLPGRHFPYQAAQHHVPLPDGDTIVLHDDQPDSWKTGDRVVLMMHGLAGCHQSPYMIRIAGKLNDVGARVFRMDHRDCGAGAGLAKKIYNAGRSDDALAALHKVIRLAPDSPVAIVGFSLSGNIVLKLLGEDPAALPQELDRAMAVNPPIDLTRSVKVLDEPLGRLYDKKFLQLLYQHINARKARFPDEPIAFERKPRKLFEFDDQFTAPMSGYEGAADYYARCSSKQFIPSIQIPTFIVTAADDPLVPVDQFQIVDLPSEVHLHIAPSGGHLGFLSGSHQDADRRWLDWRVVDWVTH